MYKLILLFAAGLLVGCGTEEVEDETYWTRSDALTELYFTGDVITAKKALWCQIRLDETVMRSGQSEEITVEGITYNLALSYTRLALINKAQARSESSDALMTQALRYWNETFDRMGEKDSGHWIVDRDLAQFHVDSLDNAADVSWRLELEFPPTLYTPRFRVGENGTLEQIDDGNSVKPSGDERTP